MFEAVNNPCIVPFNGQFSFSEARTLAKTVPDKPSMRLQVAETIVESLKGLNLQYPPVSGKQLEDIENMRKVLEKRL